MDTVANRILGQPLAVQQSLAPASWWQPHAQWGLPRCHPCVKTDLMRIWSHPHASAQNIPGVPKLEEGLNPATWMLQISTPGMEANLNTDFNEQYRNSRLYQCARCPFCCPNCFATCWGLHSSNGCAGFHVGRRACAVLLFALAC